MCIAGTATTADQKCLRIHGVRRVCGEKLRAAGAVLINQNQYGRVCDGQLHGEFRIWSNKNPICQSRTRRFIWGSAAAVAADMVPVYSDQTQVDLSASPPHLWGCGTCPHMVACRDRDLLRWRLRLIKWATHNFSCRRRNII